MKRYKLACLARVLTLLAFFLGTAPAWAHDMNVIAEFTCVGSGACEQTNSHPDADPWKGWANITVTNTGTQGWSDFHFSLFQVTDPIDNVFFDVTSPNEPTSSQAGLSWTLSGGGQVLDLFFDTDYVFPSETATFSVYTDNTTDQVSSFGLAMYPTPVPEPGTFWLLGAGLIGMARFGRRR